MKKKVYEFIKTHPHSSANKVAASLDLPGFEVLKAIHELEKKAYLKMDTPVPLSQTNDNSNYYSATGKPFVESEDKN